MLLKTTVKWQISRLTVKTITYFIQKILFVQQLKLKKNTQMLSTNFENSKKQREVKKLKQP